MHQNITHRQPTINQSTIEETSTALSKIQAYKLK